MSREALGLQQLTPGGLLLLDQVVFDNIEEGYYYYVREREPGETPYDLYGRVTDKSDGIVTFDVMFRREIIDVNEGAWEAINDDDEAGTYRADRDLINSHEDNISARFYLPHNAEGLSDMERD